MFERRCFTWFFFCVFFFNSFKPFFTAEILIKMQHIKHVIFPNSVLNVCNIKSFSEVQVFVPSCLEQDYYFLNVALRL